MGGNKSYSPFLLTSKVVYYVRYSRVRIKVNRFKIFSKNGKISGNAKGHDDLEHPLLQMMQQFVENGKQTEWEKMFKEASEKMLNDKGSESNSSIGDNLTTKTKPKDLEVGDEFLVVLLLLLKTKKVKINV